MQVTNCREQNQTTIKVQIFGKRFITGRKVQYEKPKADWDSKRRLPKEKQTL